MFRRLRQIDVFGARPFAGNPLAVVLDAEGLSTGEMQHFARWTDLSETAFFLPPTTEEADYRVRIFTLARELPFAGHPTLGSCHAWLTAGGEPRQSDLVVQECAAGLVPIRRDYNRLAFVAPPLLRSGPVDEGLVERLASVLGIDRGRIVDARWVYNGPGWVAALLEDAATVLEIQPDFGRYSGEGSLDIGLVGPHPGGSECAFEVRALFSGERGEMRRPGDGEPQRLARPMAPCHWACDRALGREPRNSIRPGRSAAYRPGCRRHGLAGRCHRHLHQRRDRDLEERQGSMKITIRARAIDGGDGFEPVGFPSERLRPRFAYHEQVCS